MDETVRTNKRVEQGIRSRARLLEAAINRFAERGFSATSVDDVCRDAGVVKSAVYWHFDSKEGLLAAVLEETANAWIDGILQTVAQTGDPRERLERAVLGMRDLVEKRPAVMRLLHSMLLERSAVSEDTRQALVRVFDRARVALVDGIAEVVGWRPPGLETTAALILAAFDGLFLQDQLRRDPEERGRLFAELERTIAILVQGLVEQARYVPVARDTSPSDAPGGGHPATRSAPGAGADRARESNRNDDLDTKEENER